MTHSKYIPMQSVPDPQTIPQTDKLIINTYKVYLRKYHYCMRNPNFICEFCIFIKNIFNSNP